MSNLSQNINFHHLNRVHPLSQPTKQKTAQKPTNSFKEIYNHQINKEIKVSKHAQKRMEERNIHLTMEQWNSLNKRLIEASEKGVKDSLVVTNNATLVVNANTKTVITALGKDEAASQIFTNINGAILLD